jgi:hypothetical protein
MVTASPLTATPTPVTVIPAATATPTLATVIRVATVTPTLATVIPVATVTPTLATAIPVATATAATQGTAMAETEGTTATTKDIATAATQGTAMAETERTATAIIGYRKSKPYREDAANKWRLLQKLLLLEIVRVLVRLDSVASNIVNTDHGIM